MGGWGGGELGGLGWVDGEDERPGAVKKVGYKHKTCQSTNLKPVSKAKGLFTQWHGAGVPIFVCE